MQTFNHNKAVAITGLLVLLIVAVVYAFQLHAKPQIAFLKEMYADIVNPDRQLYFTPTRNILIEQIFKEICFNGFLDTAIHKNAFNELTRRMSFYPSKVNYDVLCDKITANDRSVENTQAALCKSFDFDSFAILDKRKLSSFNTVTQFSPSGDFEQNNSYILIDNNFYNLLKATTRFEVSGVDTVTVTYPTSTKVATFISMSIPSVSPWFVMTRPLLIYVYMLGYFRVVYDFSPETNIMNKFSSEGSIQRLYLEPLQTSINGKTIVSQGTFEFTDKQISSFANQIGSNNVIVYYLNRNKDMPVVPPMNFATVATCYITYGNQQNFSVGAGTVSSDTDYLYLGDITVYRGSNILRINAGGQTIIASAEIDDILVQNTVTKLGITFAFNTVTIAVFYKNKSGAHNMFLYRTTLEGALKDKCFAFSTNILANPQLKVEYEIPSYPDIATSINF